MNQKRFINIAIIIGIVVIAGIAWYLFLSQRTMILPVPTPTPTPPISTSTTPPQMPGTNSGASTAYKDVKYFFDNIDPFRENLSRSGISESIFIRGKLVEVEFRVVCVVAPCPPIKYFALQDINNESYEIIIYQANSISQKLEIGKIYILKGILNKSVDIVGKIVRISYFKPEEIIKATQ